jgi:hypothetical protein
MATFANIKLIGNQMTSGIMSETKSLPYIETHKIEYGLGILELLLAVRFLFDLFNASTLNLLAKLVDVVTFPFTAPFFAVFGKDPSYALSAGQLQTLAAMLVYPIVVWSFLAIYKGARNRTVAELN